MTNQNNIQVESPGRINLIGEHIDYNGGMVLPAAIDLKINFSIIKREDSICAISTDLGKSFSFDLLKTIELSDQTWENYILGVVSGLKRKHPEWNTGFDCSISSKLPLGSGISSSAALECGLAKGLNDLFRLDEDLLELVRISRDAEHNFVGTKCGIMDQFAVSFGKENSFMLLDCNTLEYSYVKADLTPYVIVLLNTNVSHNLSTSAYNKRREDCESALRKINIYFPEYKYLADVSLEAIDLVKDELTTDQYANATYVVEEQGRTIKAAELLSKGAIEGVGELMYASHKGLSEKYKVSCKELDFMVDYSKDHQEVIGSRMMGGGFGGCTINLIHQDFLDNYIEAISIAYFNAFNIKLSPIFVKTSDGVKTF